MADGGQRWARAAGLLRATGHAGLAAALLGLACGRAEPPAPELPPLRIEVEVDQAPRPPVESARLAAIAPDLEQGERRAWDLGPLVGEEYYEPGARLDVIDASGTSTSFAEPSRRQDGRRPALVLNQKGAWFVELVEPGAEVAHGRGGNRGRSGAGTQRMADVARLRLFTPSGGAQRRRPPPAAEVRVVLGDDTLAVWTPENLAGLAPLPIETSNRRLQQAWGLREAVAALPGPAKRVVRLHAEGGRDVELTERLWEDAERVPVLRLNQRGLFKLEWVDARGRRSQGPELRGLTRVELAPERP